MDRKNCVYIDVAFETCSCSFSLAVWEQQELLLRDGKKALKKDQRVTEREREREDSYLLCLLQIQHSVGHDNYKNNGA